MMFAAVREAVVGPSRPRQPATVESRDCIVRQFMPLSVILRDYNIAPRKTRSITLSASTASNS